MSLVNTARTRKDEARAQLTSVNLPGSLEAFKSGEKVPDSLWEKIERLARFGGEGALRAKLAELEENIQRAESTMEQVEKSLAEEEKIDDSFRNTFERVVMFYPYSTSLCVFVGLESTHPSLPPNLTKSSRKDCPGTAACSEKPTDPMA